MTDAFSAVGVSVIAAVLVFLLREMGFKGAKLVGSVGVIILITFAVLGMGRLTEGLDISYFGEEVGEAALLLLKIIGISYVFGTAADVCRELGEGGIASAMLVVGRVEILLLILPVLREIIGLGTEYMK